jgi:protein disulfide-isomerase
MKPLLIMLAATFVCSTLFASEGEWLTDLAKAQETAKAEKKMVLIDFTGSDWCPPCKNLHKTVLMSDEFAKFAKDNLVLVEIDFPRTKPQPDDVKAANRALAKKFEVKGYPTVVVLDSDGKELSKKVGYGGTSAKDYVKELAKLKR